MAIGRDQVDAGAGALQMVEDVGPVVVRRERRAIGVVGVLDILLVELVAELVPGRQADLAAARDVDGCKVQWLAEQALLQGGRDELVDLVTESLGQAEYQISRIAIGVDHVLIERRVEEHVEQLEGLPGVGIGDLERLGQHRVAEAEHGLGELEADARVDVGGVGHELRQRAVERADILVDGDVVVFRLGDDTGGLIEALAVPDAGRGLPLRKEGIGCGCTLIGENCRSLGLYRGPDVGDLAVVLLVEDVVHGGEADVLVAAAVAGDDMLIDRDEGIRVDEHVLPSAHDRAVGIAHEGIVGGLWTNDDAVRRPSRAAIWREQEFADGVDAQHWRVMKVVRVIETDADAQRIELDVGPGGEADGQGIVRRAGGVEHGGVARDDAARRSRRRPYTRG